MERLQPNQIEQPGLFIPLEGFKGQRADLLQKFLESMAKNNLVVEYVDPSPRKNLESVHVMSGDLGAHNAVELDRFLKSNRVGTHSRNRAYNAINAIHRTAVVRSQSDNPHVMSYEQPLLYDLCTGELSQKGLGGNAEHLDIVIDMDALSGYLDANALKDDHRLSCYPDKRPEGYYKGIGITTRGVLTDFRDAMAEAVRSEKAIALA